ncbi:unnamed protein product [Spirodela intermedia]|uniref:Uncharacterized protein n=1 Tax=Spirodela intermedia TaxID=51605 RepID=A0A7I8KW13_SPIIN|nr:unnamed protein product [Spirodela intermedia]
MPSSEVLLRQWNRAVRSCTADGRHADALAALGHLRRAGARPDCYAAAAAAKSCGALSAVPLGRSLHGFLTRAALSSSPAVAKGLTDMYFRLGLLHDSLQMFSLISPRDAAAWNILLSGHSRLRLLSEVTSLFGSMHAGGGDPNSITVAVVLSVCAKLGDLTGGRVVHGYVVKKGLAAETLAGNALVSMYAKCGLVAADAAVAFREIAVKDIISWNSMIAGSVEGGLVGEAFVLLRQMVASGFEPNCATLVTVLPVCCASLERGRLWGKELHGRVVTSGMEKEVTSVCNALMAFYARIGDSPAMELVFRRMKKSSVDLVSWNTAIGGCAMNGRPARALELFHELLSSPVGLEPDAATLVTVLPACAQLGDVAEGRKIHRLVLLGAGGLYEETSVGNALLSFYSRCGLLADAARVFSQIQDRDLVSWNAMLGCYAGAGDEGGLLAALHGMRREGFRPDSVTVLTLLQGCSATATATAGAAGGAAGKRDRELHGFSIRVGFIDRPAVGNAIADVYSRCGPLEYAVRVCRNHPGRNVISGRTMISVFMKHGSLEDAQKIFNEEEDEEEKGEGEGEGEGEREGERGGIQSWNLMIQGYAQNGLPHQAIAMFLELHRRPMKPNAVTVMSVLLACSRLASIQLVRQCHGYAARALVSDDDTHLEGALLDAYCKCGGVQVAQKIFQISSGKDHVSYTAMAGGYAMSGMAGEALAIFREMLESGIRPDHVTVTILLSACSHGGLLREGLELFLLATGKVLAGEPTIENYSCVVDLFARAGRLREAYEFIRRLPREANASLWGTLLGACRIHGEVEIGRLAADRLFAVERENVGNYVVMSNIYAAEERWDAVERVRGLVKARELRKPPGCSWIEVGKSMHMFVADDLSHPERSRVYRTLKILNLQIKEPPGPNEAVLDWCG